MIKKDKSEATIQKKCQVCSQITSVTKYKHNECVVCGWIHSNRSWEFPDRVIHPNLMPLNKAINLYKKGKALEPDFEDFIGMLKFYSEVEFWHNGTKYAVLWADNSGAWTLYNETTSESSYYKDYDDFAANAHINGRKLKDIWHEVKDPYWLT